MPLNITTNAAAASASYYLGKNQSALQKSMTRLASGKKIIAPYDDPGSLVRLHETAGFDQPTRRCSK